MRLLKIRRKKTFRFLRVDPKGVGGLLTPANTFCLRAEAHASPNEKLIDVRDLILLSLASKMIEDKILDSVTGAGVISAWIDFSAWSI